MAGVRIPLTVVGGFLGSGKTTLLNRILGASHGQRIVALVNDFGAIDIDARLIAAGGGDSIALANGCVCCSLADDLTRTLIRVMAMQPPPDRIVIEASGVSDPWRIAEVGLADPALLLDGVIVVADVQAVRTHAQDPLLSDTVLAQIASADIVVLNKVDLVPPSELEATRRWVSGRVPHALIHATRDAEVPSELLWGPSPHRATDPGAGDAAFRRQSMRGIALRDGHTDAYVAWHLESPDIFRADALRQLLTEMPEGVLRLKGVVRTDEAPDRSSVLQFAGRSRFLVWCGRWDGGCSQIAAIARHRDAIEAIESRLRGACSAAREATTDDRRQHQVGPSESGELALPSGSPED